jgi:hypothetical protein
MALNIKFWKTVLKPKGFTLTRCKYLADNSLEFLNSYQITYTKKDPFYIFEKEDFRICLSKKSKQDKDGDSGHALFLIYKNYVLSALVNDCRTVKNQKELLQKCAAETNRHFNNWLLIFGVLDAMGDRTLWPLCMDIKWAQPFIEHVLRD